jgi:hypothetical protein
MAASKETRAAAAKKRASVRAQERTRRTAATPGKTAEAGVTAASVAKIVQQVIKQMSKSKPKPKPSSSKPKPASASSYQKQLAETRAANKSYRDKQIREQQRKVDESLAKAKKDKARPTATEKKAAEYRASADRIERMQAGYKYKGGSGTRLGRPR